MLKKILVITPRFPLPALGACEQDRFEGIKQLKRLGFEVSVVSKVFYFQPNEEIEKFSKDYGIPVKLMPYENKFGLRRFLNPFYWDGAAYEYSLPSLKKTLIGVLADFKPDLVWADYTYLWPLYGILRKRKIPIITRSINFEPSHFLQEDGWSFFNFFKAVSKLAGEIMAISKSDFLFAITPKEEKIYRRLGAKNINVLPLRGLPFCLGEGGRVLGNKKPLNVFFAGSTYTVSHNKKALELILKKIAPDVEKKAPGRFVFHVTGRKFPEELKPLLGKHAIYHGTVSNWAGFLRNMDIALIPSLFGAGMQQKIFEPLSRGIPTVASSRGLAGYPFKNEEHLLYAESSGDFAGCLIRLEDADLRIRLSKNARAVSEKLFSKEGLDGKILEAINSLDVRDKRL